jgi:hypothetical protein
MTFPVLGIPAATDIPSQSQAQIQTNFNNIIGWSAVDHVEYGAANAGTHNQVTFNKIFSSAPAVPGAPQSLLFTQNDAFSNPQLFYYTGTATASSNQYVAATSGSTLLMGGIILKWGQFTLTGTAGTSTISFVPAFPNTVFSLQLFMTNFSYGAVSGSFNYNASVPILSGFTLNWTGLTPSTNFLRYMAIGN